MQQADQNLNNKLPFKCNNQPNGEETQFLSNRNAETQLTKEGIVIPICIPASKQVRQSHIKKVHKSEPQSKNDTIKLCLVTVPAGQFQQTKGTKIPEDKTETWVFSASTSTKDQSTQKVIESDNSILKITVREDDMHNSASDIEIVHYPFRKTYQPQIILPIQEKVDKSEILKTTPEERKPVLSYSSESMLSVVNFNNTTPILLPREKQAPHCSIEVNVLEKHMADCKNRNPETDYELVSRVVYKTCTNQKRIVAGPLLIKNSLKSYKINEPEYFGKNFNETRSRTETFSILPNYKCVMSNNLAYSEDEVNIQPQEQQEPQHPPSTDILSVYVRTNKNEMVPPGFQKMHYKGDSCKLHNVELEARNKHLEQLEKVIKDTTSEALLAKSQKVFSNYTPSKISIAPAETPTVARAHAQPMTLSIEVRDTLSRENSLVSEEGSSIYEKYDESSNKTVTPKFVNKGTQISFKKDKYSLFSCFKGHGRRKGVSDLTERSSRIRKPVSNYYFG